MEISVHCMAGLAFVRFLGVCAMTVEEAFARNMVEVSDATLSSAIARVDGTGYARRTCVYWDTTLGRMFEAIDHD